jgi:hypothetical protein
MATGFPIIFGGGGRLWTPAQISTSIWFDASDASTIILNESTVSQWNDKSGAARNMSQSTAASQPTYSLTSTINGLPVVSLDGVNDWMSGATGLAGSNFSVFGVLRYKNATTAQQSALCNDVSGTSPSTYWQPSSGTLNAYNGAYVACGSYVLDQVDLISTTQTPTTYTIYRSGTVAGTGGAMGGGVVNTGWQIGRLGNGSLFAYAQVDWAEMITLNNVNTTTRQLVEGYLAWKWGLQNNLAANHPYKNTPPKV